MIIHVSSSQCLQKRKALFIPFPAVQLGCQWRLHPLIRHQRFLSKLENRVTSPSNPPAGGFSTSASSKARTTWWASLENGRKQFTGNTGNPILSQRGDTHAANVSSPSVFPSISTENKSNKSQKGNNGTAAAHEYCIDSASQLKRCFHFN